MFEFRVSLSHDDAVSFLCNDKGLRISSIVNSIVFAALHCRPAVLNGGLQIIEPQEIFT